MTTQSPAPYGRYRRTRGHAAIATAVSPEVRQARAALLADRERQREIDEAQAAVEKARLALEARETNLPERTALNAAMARLAEVEGATAAGDRPSVKPKR